MRTFLILASFIGVTYAGVGVLSPREEAEALQLFANICSGYGADGGRDVGWARVYCKRGSGELTETAHHQVSVPGGSGPAQTVFIQPPPVRYYHRVQIQSGGGGGAGGAGGGGGGGTKIYVLPQRANHEVSADFRPGQNAAVKPVVYFLKGGSSSGGSGGGGSGYGAPIAQQPPSNYGAPIAQQPPSNYGAPIAQQPPSNYGAPQQLRTTLSNFLTSGGYKKRETEKEKSDTSS